MCATNDLVETKTASVVVLSNCELVVNSMRVLAVDWVEKMS